MASPRTAVPDNGQGATGNPIIDSANAVTAGNSDSGSIALEGNRPAQPSPLKSSTTAADLDTAYPLEAITASQSQQSSSSSAHARGGDVDEEARLRQEQASSITSTTTDSQQAPGSPVETVLSAIGGAAVTAPLAALEAISHKVPDLTQAVKSHLPHGGAPATTSSPGTGTGSSGSADLAAKASQTGETLVSSAQHLASQAATYAQQGVHQLVEQLPESVTSKLPAQITTLGAPAKPMDQAATGEQAFDFTKPHTTGNFEASGSLQATHNPAIVEAQSDLAAKAESGDL